MEFLYLHIQGLRSLLNVLQQRKSLDEFRYLALLYENNHVDLVQTTFEVEFAEFLRSLPRLRAQHISHGLFYDIYCTFRLLTDARTPIFHDTNPELVLKALQNQTKLEESKYISSLDLHAVVSESDEYLACMHALQELESVHMQLASQLISGVESHQLCLKQQRQVFVLNCLVSFAHTQTHQLAVHMSTQTVSSKQAWTKLKANYLHVLQSVCFVASPVQELVEQVLGCVGCGEDVGGAVSSLVKEIQGQDLYEGLVQVLLFNHNWDGWG